MNTPLVLSGPSGVGKSHFCKLLEGQGWLYLEADPEWRHELPQKNGIDELGLRTQWNQFWDNCDGSYLLKELEIRRAKSNSIGVVLSLPSTAIATPQHIANTSNSLKFCFLVGDPKLCLSSFVDRESKNGRGLDENHWHSNNGGLFSKLREPYLQPYLVDVSTDSGSRLDSEDILAKILEIQKK